MVDLSPVLDAAVRRSDALVSKDVEALLGLLHPGFTYVNANGDMLSREQYLDTYVRPAKVQWISQRIREPYLIGAGNTAVLICLVHDVARSGDFELDETYRSTLTWIRADDGWQCLAGHTAALPRSAYADELITDDDIADDDFE